MINLLNQDIVSKKYGKGKIINVNKTGEDDYLITSEFENKMQMFLLSKSIMQQSIILCNKEIQTELLKKYSNKECNEAPKKQQAQPKIKECSRQNKEYAFSDRLKKGTIYGEYAKDIYKKGCELWGWQQSVTENFKEYCSKYAKGVAGGLSVKFLEYHYREFKQNNVIENRIDNDIIEEVRKNFQEEPLDGDLRIIFNYTGKYYYFLGVYRQIKQYQNGNGNVVVVYKRISDCYPY